MQMSNATNIATALSAQNVHLPAHRIWFNAFIKELGMLWDLTPSVIVIRMIVGFSHYSQP
jgi:hypothetical protein